MSVTERRVTWTWDTYLEWEARQELRFELVDGEVHAMTGGTTGHDIVANALRAELRQRLLGKSCRLHGPDLKIRAGENGRYPDALIDCGRRDLQAAVASEPVAIFEILSPGTAHVDQGLKLRDYNSLKSVRTYAILEATQPRALVYRRANNTGLSLENVELLDGAEASITIPELGITIPMSAIYAELLAG